MSADDRMDQSLDALLGAVRRDLRTGGLGQALACGPFTLLHMLGEGGVAQVFAASRAGAAAEPTHAVKLMRAGLDSEELLARFDRERALLERLDHPGIVKVGDAGIHSSGSPWFAMPLVHGPAITIAADLARLDLPARLKLFAQAVQAVAAAHGAGIIHRDLKPANILVEPVERKLQVRVIDFGLARAVSDAGRLTPSGVAHRMGTPDYMAPEQWALGLAACDARADVFALGIILGELMSGCLPRATPATSEPTPTAKPARPRPAPSPVISPTAGLDALMQREPSKARDLARRRSLSLRQLRAALTPVDGIVEQLTAAEPDRRPANAQAVLDLL
jgi:serine/threonine protein kinase